MMEVYSTNFKSKTFSHIFCMVEETSAFPTLRFSFVRVRFLKAVLSVPPLKPRRIK